MRKRRSQEQASIEKRRVDTLALVQEIATRVNETHSGGGADLARFARLAGRNLVRVG